MKKRLVLLPLLGGLVLTGCQFTLFGKTIKLFEKDNKEQKDSGKQEDNGPFKGLTLDGAKLYDVQDNEQSGYAKLSSVDSIDGIPVAFTDVMTNGLNSASKPYWETPNDEAVQVIQFKKSTGEITITGKITKLTVKVYSSYAFAAGQIPDVTFNGNSVTKPSSAQSTENTEYKNVKLDNSGNPTDTKYDMKLFTAVYNVNAESSSALVIKNSNTYAMYFHSFILE